MATRTIQFLGQGYGNSPATVTATWNGNTIYTGSVPTIDAVPSKLPADLTSVLFSTDVDLELSGNVPMTVTVNTGNVVLADIVGNFSNVYSRVGNVRTILSSGPDVFLSVNKIKNTSSAIYDVRNDVAIDGVPQNPVRTAENLGTWWWSVSASSELTCTVDIIGGTPSTP